MSGSEPKNFKEDPSLEVSTDNKEDQPVSLIYLLIKKDKSNLCQQAYMIA
jgi:hypothetical protein